MAEKKKRTPSQATKETRAFARLARARQELKLAQERREKAMKKYDAAIAKAKKELGEAEKNFEQVTGQVARSTSLGETTSGTEQATA